MPLQVLPAEEADLEEFDLIRIAAFRSGGGMAALMTPLPLPPNFLEKSVAKHVKSFREERDVHYLKVIDTDLGNKIIAGAKWRINEKERTEEEIQSMLPVPGPDEEGNPGMQDFMRYLCRARKEYMGTKPFYFLHILATHPDHHRRGAGAMLLKWGLEQADKAQLPAFLESTPTGKPLYARLGFEPVHEEVFDLTKYGLEGSDVSTVMIRQPQH